MGGEGGIKEALPVINGQFKAYVRNAGSVLLVFFFTEQVPDTLGIAFGAVFFCIRAPISAEVF